MSLKTLGLYSVVGSSQDCILRWPKGRSWVMLPDEAVSHLSRLSKGTVDVPATAFKLPLEYFQ